MQLSRCEHDMDPHQSIALNTVHNKQNKQHKKIQQNQQFYIDMCTVKIVTVKKKKELHD